MTSNELNASGFSFRRVWAYARYHMPRLKWEILIYAAISLLCALMCLVPAIGDIQVILFVGAWTILPILYYCGALIFATGPDTRIFERMMPVSAAEKMTFYYGYILIVIPAVVYVMPLLSAWIYMSCPALQTEKMMILYETKFHSWGVLAIINLVGAVFVAQACFWSVEYFHQNRMLMGIIAVIVANVILGILGGLIGIVAAIRGFSEGFAAGMSGCPPTEEATETIMKDVISRISAFHPLSVAVLGVIVILVLLTGWQTYRTLRYRNL